MKKKALQISEGIIKQNPTSPEGHRLKGRSLVHLNKIADAIRSFNKALKYAKGKERWYVFTERSNAYMLAGKWQKAISDSEEALQIEFSVADTINKCIALKKLNREKVAVRILQDILPKIEGAYNRACAYATLGDRKKMLKGLARAIKEDRRFRVEAKNDPDFVDYREDSGFRKLVYNDKRMKKARKG